MSVAPFGHVLVATDLSDAAAAALERAIRLPMAPGATLTLLHVVLPGASREDYAESDRALREIASVAAAGAAAAGRTDVNVVAQVVGGVPFLEIIREARRRKSDLIVIGRHGRRRFREILLGSTAERVIRNADAILVVASRPAAPYQRPLAAIDCSETSRRAMSMAWQLAAPDRESIDVVHAYESIPESALRRASIVGEAQLEQRRQSRDRAQAAVEAFLAAGETVIPATIEVREGDARRVILDVAAERASDLLALGTHGRTGLSQVLLGSVAEAVIRAASCDVVVARTGGLRFELP